MQVYFYHKSRFAVAYHMTRKLQFVDTVKLLFTEHGVPTRLRSDGAREELRSEKVQSYLTTYFCASGKSEAGNQYQNRGERVGFLKYLKPLRNVWDTCYNTFVYCGIIQPIVS